MPHGTERPPTAKVEPLKDSGTPTGRRSKSPPSKTETGNQERHSQLSGRKLLDHEEEDHDYRETEVIIARLEENK